MTIRVLDGDTINKIAAGEVIERPANALKELLENSADSGATRIEVDFEAGGKKEIKVSDDGCGIPADEVSLALERHATSKITSIDDLDHLYTFGFRGEALSALAAVSELDLHTSPHDKESGTKISARGGVIAVAEPAAPVRGTQIVVRNLFYNVPARQKFLKSDAGETAALKKMVKSFAIIHPELHITLRQGGKVINHWEREPFEKRARKTLGLTEKEAVYVKTQEGDFKMEGVLALPEFSVNTAGGLHIFVQGRPVTDRTIQQAVIEGYRSLLMQHQYPQGVISLHVDPRNIDINVHPTKSQVKFLGPGLIFRFISRAVREALTQKLSENKTELSITEGFSPEIQKAFIEDAVTHFNQRNFEMNAAAPHPQTEDIGRGTTAETKPIMAQSTPPGSGLPSGAMAVPAGYRSTWSTVQVIGQYANTYIVGQSRNALVLIDQHAAHERVLFERFSKAWKVGSIETQPALLEDILTLPREVIEAVTAPAFEETFKKLGFELTDRGPTSLAVGSRPAFLNDVSLQPLFEKLGEQVLEYSSLSSLEDLLQDMWASMACHGAIRAGRVLSGDEMRSLLSQMDEFAFSHFCPHGRPVSVNWDLYDLEKLFRRIV